jgi:hypothetical protein
MTDKVKEVPAEEPKETKPAEAVAEETKTVGEVLKSEKPAKDTALAAAEAALVDYKKENKALVKELKELVASGASKSEVSADLKTLAEKHNVEEDLVKDIVGYVRKEVQDDAEKTLRPIKEKEEAQKREDSFTKHFDKTIEEYPEYRDIAKKDVIRTLAFDPANSNKTFAQILEGAFGHLVTGKATLEKTQARGGKDDSPVDFEKASRDPKYFSEIMADPELKKQYNENLGSRISL